MIDTTKERAARTYSVRVHATNVIGLGATQLVQSLLPAMERLDNFELRTVFLPCSGALASYRAASNSTRLVHRKRYLPKAVSRVLECTLFGGSFEGEGSLLVLGDIPLRCTGRQTVFVQSTLLTKGASKHGIIDAVRYYIARGLFRRNAKFVSAFIVQTEAMKSALANTYPNITHYIHVIAQPAPTWLLAAGLKRTGVMSHSGRGLKLFYPAAAYPHKNHRLLSQIDDSDQSWNLSSLTLTIAENLNPNPKIGWITCVGSLEPREVLDLYREVDGLLFLSASESFGLPLVEAMWIGLPVICPDLPYSRLLCGNQAIYFEVASIASLRAAVAELEARFRAGWWPDWREQLKRIPASWRDAADAILRVTVGM